MSTITLPQVKNPSGLQHTDIEWADYSFNPFRAIDPQTGKVGWACVKVSEGCRNCYAEAINKRFGTGLDYSAQNLKRVRLVLDEQRIQKVLRMKPPRGPFKNGRKRPAIFVGDMTDLALMTPEQMDLLMALFALTPWADWLVLTKRPEVWADYFARTDDDGDGWRVGTERLVNIAAMRIERLRSREAALFAWPLPNVWLGTSAENQPALDKRVPHLRRCPAAVWFLSLEPLLGPIELTRVRDPDNFPGCMYTNALTGDEVHEDDDNAVIRGRGVDWVIAGGESGPRARPCNVEWIRSIVRQCAEAGAPCFVKQLGKRILVRNDRLGEWPRDGDGLIWDADEDHGMQGDLMTVWTEDTKGGNPAEWPEDLRVRQMPAHTNI